LEQKYGVGVGCLSIVRLAEQEINKNLMGMGKRGEQMIKPKIIFCINQAVGREKKRPNRFETSRGCVHLDIIWKETVPVPRRVNPAFILTVCFEDYVRFCVTLAQWVIRSGPSSVSLSSEVNKAVVESRLSTDAATYLGRKQCSVTSLLKP
jgi:hypothetical protein